MNQIRVYRPANAEKPRADRSGIECVKFFDSGENTAVASEVKQASDLLYGCTVNANKTTDGTGAGNAWWKTSMMPTIIEDMK
jgi:hypothetical protein